MCVGKPLKRDVGGSGGRNLKRRQKDIKFSRTFSQKMIIGRHLEREGEREREKDFEP